MLRLDPVTETYLDTIRLIRKLCFEFVSKRPHLKSYEDDLVSECNIIYMKCYNSHNMSKNKFSSWLGFKISKHLRTLERDIRKYHKRLPMKYLEEIPTHNIKDKTPWENLSEDAEEVISLAFRPPPDIRLYLRHRKPKGKVMRQALFSFLKDIGWASSRILESFQEIREVFR